MKTFYAAKIDDNQFSPVFPFNTHEAEILGPDDPTQQTIADLIPNPDYIPNAGVETGNGTAYHLADFTELGFPDDEDCAHWPIATAISKLESAMLKIEQLEGAQKRQLPNILMAAFKGQAAGATYLVCA